MALILALGLRAVITSVVRVTQTVSTMALAVSGAVVGANLDGAVRALPSAVAFTGTVVAVTVSEAVIQTNAGAAVKAIPPVIALAQASSLLALKMKLGLRIELNRTNRRNIPLHGWSNRSGKSGGRSPHHASD